MIVVTIGLIKARIPNAKLIVNDLMTGTMIPDKIVFCVSKEPYLLDDGIQPHELPKIDNPIVEFKYVENFGPARRIVPIVEEYWEQPETKIIIFDDDRKPGRDTIQKLVEYSNKHPNIAVSTAGNIWNYDEQSKKELEKMRVIFEHKHGHVGIVFGWFTKVPIPVQLLNPGIGCLVKPMFFSEDFINWKRYDKNLGVDRTDQTFINASLAINNIKRVVIPLNYHPGEYDSYGREICKMDLSFTHRKAQSKKWGDKIRRDMLPPIAVSIYNREKYVDNIIHEFRRTFVDLHLVHFFIDGNDNPDVIDKCKYYRDRYGIHLHINEHAGHRKNFIRILDYFKNDYEYFFTVEPDIDLSINWYKYTLTTLKREKSKDYGVYYLYAGFSVIEANKHWTWKQFQHIKHIGGSCLWLINSKYANLLKAKILEFGRNPDSTMDILITEKNSKEITRYVFNQSLVQHIGYDESTISPYYHKSFNFYGKNNDALDLLYQGKLKVLKYPKKATEKDYLPAMSNNIYHLKRRIKQKDYKIIVELGTAYGYTAINLAKLDCVEKVYTIDLFETLPDNPISYKSYADREVVFLSNVVRHKLQDKIVPIKGCSWEVGEIFQELGIKCDMVYADACHTYECTKKDIEAWLPITKFICGDDYFISPIWEDSVVKAVDDMAKVYNKDVHSIESPEEKLSILWWYEDKKYY